MDKNDKFNIDPSKYVVLDVETNGLSSIADDLLSISLYKPDTGEMYNRFLPLELNKKVVTTHINGIKTSDLKDHLPLTQEEINTIIAKFEIKSRIVLTYGNLDERFLTKYFIRHRLRGIDYFAFYNFKQRIISSRFSEGNITKDNLCNLYGIKNVQEIHSGKNDCILEWELFEHMAGKRLLITNNKVFEFNNDYIIPVSYISTYPNLQYYLPNLPKITCDSREIFFFHIPEVQFRKLQTNFNGMILEHLIDSMLQVEEIDSRKALYENKSKLRYIGELPSEIEEIQMFFNKDGSMTSTRPQDKSLEKEINTQVDLLKSKFEPIIDYISNEIFHGEKIKAQELVINKQDNVLAVCDLSSNSAILEVKTDAYLSVHSYSEQLYYEANGRKCYILQTDWSHFPKEIGYVISEVFFDIKYGNRKEERHEYAKKRIETDDISLIEFTDSKNPVTLKCKKCGFEWKTSYNLALKKRPCPECAEKKRQLVLLESEKNKHLSEEKNRTQAANILVKKYMSFQDKVDKRSDHKTYVISYKDSRSQAKAKCRVCNYEWETRADHLLDRPFCPKCKKKIVRC